MRSCDHFVGEVAQRVLGELLVGVAEIEARPGGEWPGPRPFGQIGGGGVDVDGPSGGHGSLLWIKCLDTKVKCKQHEGKVFAADLRSGPCQSQPAQVPDEVETVVVDWKSIRPATLSRTSLEVALDSWRRAVKSTTSPHVAQIRWWWCSVRSSASS